MQFSRFFCLLVVVGLVLVYNNGVDAKKHKEQKPKGTIECNLCHFIVQEVDNWLDANETESWIIRQVNKVCNTTLFRDHSKVCDAIVDYGVEEFIEFIETHETPDEVCGPDQLNLCPSQRQLLEKLNKLQKLYKQNK